MKKILNLLIGLFLVMTMTTGFAQSKPVNPGAVQNGQTALNSLQLAAANELYTLTDTWVKEFSKANPGMSISLNRIDGPNPDKFQQLTIVSQLDAMQLKDQSLWKTVVGHDVVVAIVHANNPMLGLLNQQGLPMQKIALLLSEPEKGNWTNLLKGGQMKASSVYMPQNQLLLNALGEFVKAPVKIASGRLLPSAVEVMKALENDAYGIGFCKLNDLRANTTYASKFKLLPIDKNSNGRMDQFEQIYDNLDEFSHGVWIGKYPGALIESIYAVSPAQPKEATALAFLSWIGFEGQQALADKGFCQLTGNEKEAIAAALVSTSGGDLNMTNRASAPKNWPIALTVLLLTSCFVGFYFYSRKGVKPFQVEENIQIAPFLIEHAMQVPKGLYFDKTHTWAFMEQDGNVRVGMDDFLQHVTGKLTKVKMKKAGDVVRKGEAIVTVIRDGKQLNLYAPISGTILEQNEALLTEAAILNDSPFYKGWVYQIEPRNWLREVQFLFMGEKYTDWLQDEFIRLKDFVAASVKTDKLAYQHVILQDGGELTDNVLADLGPEVWEDFQVHFIDTSR